MDECATLYLFENNGLIDEINMPPSFCGIKDIRHDTIWVKFDDVQIENNNFIKSHRKFSFIPLGCSSQVSGGKPQERIYEYQKVEYNPNNQVITIVTKDSVKKYNAPDSYFEFGDLIFRENCIGYRIDNIFKLGNDNSFSLIKAIAKKQAIVIGN